MRTRHVATLVALTGGLTAAAALHRRAGRRLPVSLPAATTTVAAPRPALALVEDREGVVLPFVRPVVAEPAPVQEPAAPARCRDTGGQTKAGAPCNARATVAGRCHHHRVAA
jgi:hypothetical protein